MGIISILYKIKIASIGMQYISKKKNLQYKLLIFVKQFSDAHISKGRIAKDAKFKGGGKNIKYDSLLCHAHL